MRTHLFHDDTFLPAQISSSASSKHQPTTISSAPQGSLTSSFLRGAVSHPNAQRAAFVQVPKLHELLRHGVEPLTGQDVVVVMVADRLLVQADGKRPEAVGCHFLAQPQG